MRKKAWIKAWETEARHRHAAEEEARHLRAERKAYLDEIDRLRIQVAGTRAQLAVRKVVEQHRQKRPYINLGG